jgi:hypothetical protein
MYIYSLYGTLITPLQKTMCQDIFRSFRHDSTSPDAVMKRVIEERRLKLSQIDQWNTETRNILMRLMRLLYKTVASWQVFASKDARYLYQTGALTNIGLDAVQTLASINDLVSDLDRLHDELRHQLEVFEKGYIHEHEQHSRDVRCCFLHIKASSFWSDHG